MIKYLKGIMFKKKYFKYSKEIFISVIEYW